MRKIKYPSKDVIPDNYIKNYQDVEAYDGVGWSIKTGNRELNGKYIYGTDLEKITSLLKW